MYDQNRSRYSVINPYPVAAGATIAAEGAALVAVDDGMGGIAAAPSTGGAGEQFLGWSRTDNVRVATEVVIETVTVPVGGGTVNLAHGQLVTGSIYAYDNTAAAALTVVAIAPLAGQVQINLVQGTATFNAAEAGNSVTITYRRNITVVEQKLKYRDRLPNNISTDYLSQVGAMAGQGVFFTDQYDSSQAYASLDPIYLGAGGLVTSAAGGTLIGYAHKIPTAGDVMLAVKFQDTI